MTSSWRLCFSLIQEFNGCLVTRSCTFAPADDANDSAVGSLMAHQPNVQEQLSSQE